MTSKTPPVGWCNQVFFKGMRQGVGGYGLTLLDLDDLLDEGW